MSDTIVKLAMAWAAAREARLAVGKDLREAENETRDPRISAFARYRRIADLPKQRAEAKRIELAAARALFKACNESKKVPTIDVQAIEIKPDLQQLA